MWVAINQNGEAECGVDEETAAARLLDGAGGESCYAVRTVRLVCLIRPPEPVEVRVVVRDDVGHVVDVRSATD